VSLPTFFSRSEKIFLYAKKNFIRRKRIFNPSNFFPRMNFFFPTYKKKSVMYIKKSPSYSTFFHPWHTFFLRSDKKFLVGPKIFNFVYQKSNFTPLLWFLDPPNHRIWPPQIVLFGGSNIDFSEVSTKSSIFHERLKKSLFEPQKRCQIRVPKSDFSSPNSTPQMSTPKYPETVYTEFVTGRVFRGGGAKVRNSPSGG
jgi:hypothetical protein